MQQINRPRSESFSVGDRKIGRPNDDRIQIHRNVQKGAPGKEAFKPVKCSVSLTRNMLARASWQ